MKQQNKQKPISKCYSCELNLGDHCWLHESPRDQWDRYNQCPSFEDPEQYRAFQKWLKQPSVPARHQRKKRGSRANPSAFQPQRAEDIRKLNRPERERLDRMRPEKAVLVQMILPGMSTREMSESLRELARLTDTAGAKVVGSIVQRRSTPGLSRPRLAKDCVT